ncbi:RNA-directed DNA polymerase from mobile element jockey-like 46, partial [Homarus americanus]
MEYKIPKETEFNHAYEVVVALELEYKNINWRTDTFPQDHNTAKILSEVTNLNGKTVKIIPLDPEEKTTRMVRLRYPLELPVEVIIKHPKVTKAECCVTSQDKTQTRQVLVDIKGDSPRGGRPRQLGNLQVASFCPRTTTMLQMSGIWTAPIQVPQKSEMWHLQPKPQDRNVYSKTQGRNHHDSQVPKLWKETSRLEHIMPREERANKSCNGKNSTTKHNRSTSEHNRVGSTATETVNPTPTPPQLSEDSFPALPPPGYRTKFKTLGQNQSISQKRCRKTRPQNSTTTSGTDDALESDIRQEEELAIRERTQHRETSSPLQRMEQQAQTVSKHTITDKSDSTLKREEKTPEIPPKTSGIPPPAPPSEQNSPTSLSSQDNTVECTRPVNKRHTVQAAAIAKNIDVFILQETLMSKDKQFRLPGYQQYSVPKAPNSYGSMILVRATIPSPEVEPVHCGDGVEAQAVRIHLANDSLVVYKIYKPPPKRLEAGGDFNAHHPTINSTTRMNQDGHHLVELLTDVPEITLINTGEPTHILGGTLDLTFISTELVPVAQWEMDDELTSDHFATTITLRVELLPPPPRPPPRWNTKKANWKLYQDELQKWLLSNMLKIREDKWLEWCATFNAHTSLSELWRKLRIATGKLPRAPAHPQPLQEANRLAEHFAERSSSVQLPPEIRLHLQQVQLEREVVVRHAIEQTDTTNCLFTIEEIRRARKTLITGARESDIKNGLLRALNLNRDVFNKKTWLLCAAEAVNRLKLKDTILSKGPDTLSPDYSTPAPWESPPAVFNILQTGTRKAD